MYNPTFSGNKMYRVLFLVIPIISIFVSGCLSTQEAIPMSQNTYMIRVEDHAGIFAFNRGKMKGEAFKKSQKFAKSKGKVAIPLGMKEHPVGVLGDWAAVEYQFKLVDKDSQEANGGHLIPRADIVIDKKEDVRIHGDIRTETKQSKDLYTELMKLEDLRKKGILTDDEFKHEKQKLLKK